MNAHRLEEWLKVEEGFRSRPYKDTLGTYTDGYGNTADGDEPITKDTPPKTEPKARHELHADIFEAILHAEDFYPDLRKLTDVRQEVIIAMAFQLGPGSLAKFVGFKARLQMGDYRGAASHLRNSLWARQTPARVERCARMIENG